MAIPSCPHIVKPNDTFIDREILAWHFLHKDWKLRDGKEAPQNGVWLEYSGDLSLCSSGLHASERLEDAFIFAPSGCLCRVICGGKVITSHDKLVCNKRKIIERHDIGPLIFKMYQKAAKDVLQKIIALEDVATKTVAHIKKNDVIKRFIECSQPSWLAVLSHLKALDRRVLQDNLHYTPLSCINRYLYTLKAYLFLINVRKNGKFYHPKSLCQNDYDELIKQIIQQFKTK
jgi:hypothetical protein